MREREPLLSQRLGDLSREVGPRIQTRFAPSDPDHRRERLAAVQRSATDACHHITAVTGFPRDALDTGTGAARPVNRRVGDGGQE